MLAACNVAAQIKITSKEKLQIPALEYWMQAQFSPSGKNIYVTIRGYNGIWKYSLESKTITEITRDAGSGFNFSLSQDEKQIAYRRTLQNPNSMMRTQEIVVKNFATMEENVVSAGDDIQTPVFIANKISYTNLRTKKTVIPAVENISAAVLGIEDQKIALAKNGKKEIFDPLGNGRYIWPAVSPNGAKLAAVDMERGAFIVNTDGKNLIKIKKCNAPAWTRSGKFVIGMDDTDDGHEILSSEIIAVSADGKQRINLTQSADMIELYPNCSSVENKIVLTTLAGEVYVLTYEEVQ